MTDDEVNETIAIAMRTPFGQGRRDKPPDYPTDRRASAELEDWLQREGYEIRVATLEGRCRVRVTRRIDYVAAECIYAYTDTLSPSEARVRGLAECAAKMLAGRPTAETRENDAK
jgi:hypothetical protein